MKNVTPHTPTLTKPMKYIATLFFTFALFFSSNVFADTSVGHVNTQQVMASFEDAITAQTSFKAKEREIQQSFLSKFKEFEKKYQDYEANKKILSAERRQITQQELERLHNTIKALQQRWRQDLEATHLKLIQPIEDKVFAAINTVADKNMVDIVIVSSQPGLKIYANKIDLTKTDLTEQVIQLLNKKD